RKAEVSALQELERVQERYRRRGWASAIGASGTIRAVSRVLRESGWSDGAITRPALTRLRDAVLAAGSVDRLELPGLSGSRATVFPGGLAVLSAIFESLGVESMQASDSALREGLLEDLL